MNKYHEDLLVLLDEIESKGLTRREALYLILAGELSRLNDSVDCLKHTIGNVDDSQTKVQ